MIPKGIQNLGNTCFINACMQILLQTPELDYPLHDKEGQEEYQLYKEWKVWRENVENPSISIISPISFLQTIQKIAEMKNQVSGYSEEDLKAYSDYFFTQQDPMRMVTQNDVDTPLSPESEDGNYYFKACLQDPVILFYGSDKIITSFSSERKLLLNGTYSFNYENAIAAKSGVEIQLNATDFGLELFNEKAKFQLKDNYLGKDVTQKLEIKEFNAGKTTVTLILPENIQKIAYKLACIPPNEEEKISTRWVIVNK